MGVSGLRLKRGDCRGGSHCMWRKQNEKQGRGRRTHWAEHCAGQHLPPRWQRSHTFISIAPLQRNGMTCLGKAVSMVPHGQVLLLHLRDLTAAGSQLPHNKSCQLTPLPTPSHTKPPLKIPNRERDMLETLPTHLGLLSQKSKPNCTRQIYEKHDG